MTSAGGFQGNIEEWGWPVVDTAEPEGVRPVRGYVTIFKRTTKETGSAHFTIHFADADGRPLQGLDAADLEIFYGAALAALTEMGLREELLPAGDIVR